MRKFKCLLDFRIGIPGVSRPLQGWTQQPRSATSAGTANSLLNLVRLGSHEMAPPEVGYLVVMWACVEMAPTGLEGTTLALATTVGNAGQSLGPRPGRGQRPLATTPHSFRGSFSAVSTPILATKYSFCSIFQDLQNELAEFSKNSQNFAIFANSAKSQ